jgi:hypothetical protein
MNYHNEVMGVVAEYEAAMQRNYDDAFERLRQGRASMYVGIVAYFVLLAMTLVMATIS